MGFPDSVSDGIRLKHFYGVPVGTSDGATLGFIDNTMLGVTNSSFNFFSKFSLDF